VPTALIINGFRFYFWSNEEDRAHIHIVKGEGNAKYWLAPKIECVFSYNYKRAEVRFIERVIKKEYSTLIKKWNDHAKKKTGKNK
jgi:hypothetical protein